MAESATPPAPRRRFGRTLAWLAGELAIVAVALVAGAWALLGSQAALDYALQRAVQASAGRLAIEGGEGSLLSTVRVARLAWRGDGVAVEARDVALTWSPLDFLSRRIKVEGLGAKRLSFDFAQAGGAGGGLPESLALPLDVEIRNIGVERVEWRTGTGEGHVTGVAFAYAGSAAEHAVRDLRLVTAQGTLTGRARVGAAPPYALDGALAFAGDGHYRGGAARVAATGTLARIGVAADGELRGATLAAKATLAPFAPAMLESADVTAQDVDLAQFGAALPTTRLALEVSARPEGAGFAGTLSARNDAAGTLDAGRVPLTALAARFAWDGATATLSGIDAQLAGGGRATGTAAIPVRADAVALDLALTGIDLARIQSSLVATRMSGTLVAEVGGQRQVVRGDVRQADLSLAFAATVEGRRVVVERARARAGAGEVTGSGSLALDAARAFTLSARATKFDPARFVAMPASALDGTVEARGTLAPAWDVTASIVLDKSSRLAGHAASGTARARATPGAAKDVAVDLRVGTATLKLDGAFGGAGDALAYAFEAPHLAELAPLVARHATDAVPAKLAGALAARGRITGAAPSPGFTVDAHGSALAWGEAWRVAKVDLTASVAPGVAAAGPVPLAARPVAIAIAAAGVVGPAGTFPAARANVTGTLARHAASLALSGEGIAADARVAGGVVEGKRADGTRELAWQGTVEALDNRGSIPFRLEAPAVLEVAPGRVRVGATRVAVVDGHADMASLALDDGRIATRGTFTGIPFNALVRLAGRAPPFTSTLVVGGDWSLAATPRLNGEVNVRRERGDWYGTDSAAADAASLALGISELAVGARFADDALAATARFRSARAGNADASARVAAGAVPGRVAADAPLEAALKAELASLKPLQPWLGTAAVMDGRAQVDVTARGTLAAPVLAGTLTGDALRFDLPQYGVHLRDGRLRARVVERALVLDELSLAGGDGRFTARGTLLRAVDAPDTRNGTRVEWSATDFTVVNRPDLLVVADGDGTLALENGRLVLAGKIAVDRGRVIYEATSVGRLSDDVVIVGQPRQAVAGQGADLPLALDVEVALGRDFRFSGEGLETRLAGRVRVTTTPAGTLAANGRIRAVAGTYYVFGQRLDIDRGQLIFDGPANNPALDVVAVRRNLAVEAGVEVTGTVRQPRVRLVSNPPVPDGEKLSWLLTGQGLDRAGRGDVAMLSAASASLLGQGRKPITQQIANTVGLDDISVRETTAGVTGGTSGQVVAFGKRISDRLSLVYEQGLTVATNALRIEYTLSRSWTLRAEAGVVSSFGIFFRRTYE